MKSRRQYVNKIRSLIKKYKPQKKNKTEILEMKNTITEVKKQSIESFNIGLDYAKQKISEIKYKSFEISHLEKQKEKRMGKKE